MAEKHPPVQLDPPGDMLHSFTQDTAFIEIPRDIRSLRQKDIQAAKKWRVQTGDFFEKAFQKGYIVTDVVFSKDNNRMFYRLTR